MIIYYLILALIMLTKEIKPMIEKRRNMDIFGFDLSASDNFIIYAMTH